MTQPSDGAAMRWGFFKFWLALGFVLCAVFLYGCLMHDPPGDPHIPYFDKMQHSSAFIVMSAWFGALFRPRYWRVLLVLSAFGAITEILQWYSGYRDGSPFDWMADTVGALIGLAFVRIGAMRWLRYIDERVTAATH